MNLYAYVGNDPVNMSDSTGKSACWIDQATECSGDRTDDTTHVLLEDGSELVYIDKGLEPGTASVRLTPQYESANGAPATVTDEMEGKLLKLSEIEGKPVYVTSGVRTPEQNAIVGGAPGSSHLVTNEDHAADIKIPGNTRHETFEAARDSGLFNRTNEYNPNLPTYRTGRGVHVDLRSTGNQGAFINWVHQPEPNR